MTTHITFWSDSLPEKSIPNDTFKPLRAETVRQLMVNALESAGPDHELFANIKRITRDSWDEETISMANINGMVMEEVVDEGGNVVDIVEVEAMK